MPIIDDDEFNKDEGDDDDDDWDMISKEARFDKDATSPVSIVPYITTLISYHQDIIINNVPMWSVSCNINEK